MPGRLIDRMRAGLERYGQTGEAPTGFLAPDFELRQSSSIIGTAGVFRGPSAFEESLKELDEAFEDMVFEPEDVLEAPGGEIVALIHTRGRGRVSGVEADNHIAWVWTFRDGKAIRMVIYEEQAEALAAVGLAE